MADEFVSFDKVLRDLQMQEEELKRLVSEGEIRAFRDQDKMKFKMEDVERFRRARQLAKDDTLAKEEVPEELVFDEDDANQEVGMATAAIADDSFLEEETTTTTSSTTTMTSAKTPGRAARTTTTRKRVTVEDETETEGAIWKVLILAATLILFVGTLVAFDAARATPTGLTKPFADMFKDQ